MSKLPQDYINFIARGIAQHLKLEGVEQKDNYTEEDLIEIFQCENKEELYSKINKIEEDSIKAMGLPIKDSYSLNEIEEFLNLNYSGISNLKIFFDEP